MRVHHDVAGSGAPLLLVAGLGQTGRRWRRVVAALEDAFTVVTLDNRGVGATGPCAEGFTLAEMAADALEVMGALGHQTFFLAGHSMGGMIAQEIVRQAPERVRAAVLLSTDGGAASRVPADLAAVFGGEGGARTADPLEVAEHAWSRLTGPGFAEAHPDVIAEEARLSVEQATPPMSYVLQIQAIAAWDPGVALVGTSVPLAIAHGDADPLVPYENGVRVAAKYGLDLLTYEGAGHMLDCERVPEIATLMRDHFGAVSGG